MEAVAFTLVGLYRSRDKNIVAHDARAVLAAADAVDPLRRPRTITTVAELAALGEGTVIRDSAQDVSEKRSGYWCGFETAAMEDQRQAKYLPATILHEPTL